MFGAGGRRRVLRDGTSRQRVLSPRGRKPSCEVPLLGCKYIIVTFRCRVVCDRMQFNLDRL